MISVTIDASRYLEWAKGLSSYRLRLAAKNSLNRAGRAARKQFIADTVADANAPAARVKAGISKFRAASPSNLVAAFDAKAVKIGIGNTKGAVIAKGQGLVARTHVVSGGGSASLTIPRAFVLKSNGGKVIVIRKGRARGDLKAIYAEMPNTALRQPYSAPRKEWEANAAKNVERELQAGLAAVLAGGTPPADSGSND